MDTIEILQHRYTTKIYDPKKRIPDRVFDQIQEVLRLCPSSVNVQPWHFIVADDEAGKARIAKSASGVFAFNFERILDASHVIVLCANKDISLDYQRELVEQEERDGRFSGPDACKAAFDRRAGYIASRDKELWAQKQVYIAAGFALFAAAELGVDATPIEGFDPKILDMEFDLDRKGLRSTLVISFGYHSELDRNRDIPKSRLPRNKIFSRA